MTATALASTTLDPAQKHAVAALGRSCAEAFGSDFQVFDAAGNRIDNNSVPLGDEGWMLETLRAVAGRQRAEIVAQTSEIVVLALPLVVQGESYVAAAPFVCSASHGVSAETAQLLGMTVSQATRWINEQPIWPSHALLRFAAEFQRRHQQESRAQQLKREMQQLSAQLSENYEEISLLHRVSQNFRLSSSDEELGQLALKWLSDCVPVESMLLVYMPVAKPGESTYPARTDAHLLIEGKPIFDSAFDALDVVDALPELREGRPAVINRGSGRDNSHLPPSIRQLIAVPMQEGNRVLGYLLAINHHDDAELGSVEAKLLASVAAMLAVHCSNRDLYRQQAEFIASVVRALTSAIDAKDPYTCGHSDRVARISTRLAQELGCDTTLLSTIYMAGLLHDIGKIGIDDAVLRKPGRLTEAEFNHIKQHPGLGYKILADLKPLSDVLPAVLHHHEQWDGHGYPCELRGEQIPFMARVVAVADAFDAMTSDRPYRPGMPWEKVKEIFRGGAGIQWDPEVIEAFFRALPDIRNIASQDRAELSLDVQQWLAS